ncbi:hypothetical protein [Caenispirillum bisanense]|uniref:hypothetical protein n=1 Tax=Caenispirillum bisanense TaxID=414052 RepID=UPI0031E0B035
MTYADEKTRRLADALDAMLLDNEDISARGAVRHLGGTLKYATDITRHAERRQLLEAYQCRQAELRSLIEKVNKQSKSNLSLAVERKDREIAALARQRDLLIASHKAMILAVSEMRGRQAWLRFFQHYQGCIEELAALGAMPSADVFAFAPTNDEER